jgi:citrate synthase
MADKPSTGLADIIATSTAPSDFDGRAALLFYRGHDIHRPAGSAFGEIAYLLQRRELSCAPGHGREPRLGSATAGRGRNLNPAFSVTRMAHVIEQRAARRLIRPDREYVGERVLTWASLDRR